MTIVFLVLALFLLASPAFSAENDASTSPLSVSLGTATENAVDAVLDGQFVGTGERLEQQVSIRNNSNRTIDVDAFVAGVGILALWVGAPQLPSTRARLGPGTIRALNITIIAVANLRDLPSIVFMEKWKEIGHLDVLYHALPAPILPPDGIYEFGPYLSGQGQDMSDAYAFCTPPPPIGYRIVSSTGSLSAHKGFENHPRGCLAWAECGGPFFGVANTGVCYSAKVQGYYEKNGPQGKVEFDFAIKIVLGPNERSWQLKSPKDMVNAVSAIAQTSKIQ